MLEIMVGEEGSTNTAKPAESGQSDQIFPAIQTIKQKLSNSYIEAVSKSNTSKNRVEKKISKSPKVFV